MFEDDTDRLSPLRSTPEDAFATQRALDQLDGLLRVQAAAPFEPRAAAVRSLLETFLLFRRAGLNDRLVPILEHAHHLSADLGADMRLTVLLQLGEFEVLRNNVSAALTHLALALKLAQQAGLRVQEARAWAYYGLALQSAGLYTQAEDLLRHALTLLTDQHQPALCANIWAWRIQLRRHDDAAGFEVARYGCQQALAFGQQVEPGERDTFVCTALCNWAALELLRGAIREAKALLVRAALSANLNPQQRWMIRLLEGMVAIYEDNSPAHRACVEALLRPEHAPPRVYVIDALAILAAVYSLIDEPELATQALAALVVERAQAFGALIHAPALTTDVLRIALDQAVPPVLPLMAAHSLLERIAVTAELRDDATGKHCFRVGRLAAILAARAGRPEAEAKALDLAARLHDIGKVAIPDTILLKPGRLNPSEMNLMREHTRIGAGLLGAQEDAVLDSARLIALHHHEWWDGSGYPDGLCGEAIPLPARITALADVFDALTHPRPYKPAWTVNEALAHLSRSSGTQFDPQLCPLFVQLIREVEPLWPRFYAALESAAECSPFVTAQALVSQVLGQG